MKYLLTISMMLIGLDAKWVCANIMSKIGGFLGGGGWKYARGNVKTIPESITIIVLDSITIIVPDSITIKVCQDY